jgi:hypothetical protein
MTRLFPPEQQEQRLGRVMAAITDPRKLNTKRERSYPRVIKRARHNSYRIKKPGQHGTRHNDPPTIKLCNPVLTSKKIKTVALSNTG